MIDGILWKLICLFGVVSASGILAVVLVPLLSRLAIAVGLVDNPDSRRKLHERPIPLAGGMVIFITTVLVAGVGVVGFGEVLSLGPVGFGTQHLGLLLAGGLILAIGLVDDRFKIRGRFKLLGQIAVATLLIGSGYFFDKINIGPYPVHFGVFAVLIVYFWLLGTINSVNLLDGADGFAGTLGFVVSLAIAVMALMGKEMQVEAIIAAAMAGAIGGFLGFNLPPARVYLGDGGSMLIGLVLGALAISTALKEQAFYSFVAPLAMLTIPILDTAVAVVRRRMTGRGIYAVDRGHLHHRLLGHGLSPRMAVVWMFILCGTTALGGLLSFATRESEFALIAVVLVVGFLVAGKVFGFAEFSMVGRRMQQLTMTAVGRPRGSVSEGTSEQFQLQGTRDWGQLFEMARRFAEEQGLDKLTIDVNAPWIHESYHAIWKARGTRLTEGRDEWTAHFPLVMEDRVFGRVEVSAGSIDCGAYRCLPKLMDLLDSSAPEVLDGPEPDRGPMPSPPETVAADPKDKPKLASTAERAADRSTDPVAAANWE